jgi:RNA polymerase sigma factor for flagellar operon FliA
MVNTSLNSPEERKLRCGEIRARVTSHTRSACFEERQRFLLENLSEVRHLARLIHRRLPNHVSYDDLVHSGVLGLLDAVKKFDPSRNASFRTYARVRIRGAILDSLRELDWGPRSLRRLARRIEHARNELTAGLGRVPSEPELANRLGLSFEKLQILIKEIHGLTFAVWQQQSESASQKRLASAYAWRAEENPFELYARSQCARLLAEAIDSLNEKQRLALALYYFDGRTMKEVGVVLRLHESRVSQIISAALGRLRAQLFQRFKSRSQPRNHVLSSVHGGMPKRLDNGPFHSAQWTTASSQLGKMENMLVKRAILKIS